MAVEIGRRGCEQGPRIGSVENIICLARGQDNALIMGLCSQPNDRVGERSAAFRRGAVFSWPRRSGCFLIALLTVTSLASAGVGDLICVELYATESVPSVLCHRDPRTFLPGIPLAVCGVMMKVLF
jgi:hypothetical protein